MVAQNSAQLAARVESLEGDLELLKEAHKTDMDAAAAELASVQEACTIPCPRPSLPATLCHATIMHDHAANHCPLQRQCSNS
jgi:hypothetical protein